MSEFEVGDKVRFVGDTTGYTGVVKMLADRDNDHGVKVQWAGGKETRWEDPEALELAEELAYITPPTRLPTDAKARKDTPITTGVLDYFPLALAEIARVSKAGNDQHNPGQPLHWAKGKSTDHADCLVRHLLERGTKDTDGQRHSAKMAWRALALLQTELEKETEK